MRTRNAMENAIIPVDPLLVITIVKPDISLLSSNPFKYDLLKTGAHCCYFLSNCWLDIMRRTNRYTFKKICFLFWMGESYYTANWVLMNNLLPLLRGGKIKHATLRGQLGLCCGAGPGSFMEELRSKDFTLQPLVEIVSNLMLSEIISQHHSTDVATTLYISAFGL